MAIHTRALNHWLLAQACVWVLVLVGLAWWLAQGGVQMAQFWLWAGLLSVGHLALVRILGAGGTVADKVTLARGLLFISCAGLAWTGGEMSLLLWLGICLALGADLLDGWCARRFGATEAGAMLDMETDQATTLGLACLLIACAGVGVWALCLPAYRYLFILLARGLGIPADDPKPCDGDNRRARLICAAMMLLLLLGLCPWLPAGWAPLCTAVPVALLAWSYGGDLRYLLRRRRVLREVAAAGGLLSGQDLAATSRGTDQAARRQLP